MVERELLLYISFMIWKITQEHYVPPPNHCMRAMTCNHSSIPLCGFEKNKNCYRMFLDECDLYEYNCDNKADFFTSEINNCNQMSDGNYDLCDSKQNKNTNGILTTTTNTTTIKMTTTAEGTTAKNTTVVPFSLSNITTCTKDNDLTTEMVTEKSNVNKNITVPSNTTIVTSTIVTTFTNKNSSNTTTIRNETDRTSNEIFNNTTIKDATTIVSTTTVKLNASSVAKEETTESMTKQTTDKVDAKPEDCDFPNYCDRPKTWLTTSKGETRDFYRIIKDYKGN